MFVKVWLDDIRPAPQGFEWAKDVFTATTFFNHYEVIEMSLDHDLGESVYGETPVDNGVDLIKWMSRNIVPDKWPSTITIHSMNPGGAKRMEALLLDYAPRFVKIVIKPFGG